MAKDILQQLISDTVANIGATPTPTPTLDPVIIALGANFLQQVKLLTADQKLAIKNFLHDNDLV